MSTWLGVDLGGTKIALRAESPDGQARQRVARWQGRGLRSDLAQLGTEVDTLRQELPGGFGAVGIALPATVAADGRVVAWPNRPEWIGLDIRRTTADLFGGVPVGWADDGDLGALAEAGTTACDHVLYVGVGTGIGGGLTNGTGLLPGIDRGSFEIGHVVTDPDGPPCRCGRRGCVQASASGPATLARASLLRGNEVSFDELRQGLLAGQEWAVQAVDHSCHRLAVAITGVRELLHPGVVVVGGGFASGLPGFVDTIAHHLTALARPGVPAPPVRGSRFGDLSTLYGAVALARLLGRTEAAA